MIYGGTAGFDDLPETVERTVEALRPHVRKFDSIIVTGISGQSVGFPVSLALGKPLVVRRKDIEDSHGIRGGLLNKHRIGTRALFLDDLISTGRTYARCAQAAEAAGAKVVGAYTYSGGGEFAHWGPRGAKPATFRRAERSLST